MSPHAHLINRAGSRSRPVSLFGFVNPARSVRPECRSEATRTSRVTLPPVEAPENTHPGAGGRERLADLGCLLRGVTVRQFPGKSGALAGQSRRLSMRLLLAAGSELSRSMARSRVLSRRQPATESSDGPHQLAKRVRAWVGHCGVDRQVLAEAWHAARKLPHPMSARPHSPSLVPSRASRLENQLVMIISPSLDPKMPKARR
jgi:hypothetical protein